MKKKYLIVLSLFLLTGCSATYNLEIKDDTYKETLYINNDIALINEKIGNKTYKQLIDEDIKRSLPVLNTTPGIFETDKVIDEYKYYKKEIVSDENNYGLKIKHEFNYEDYINATIPNQSYNSFDVIKNDDTVVITTDDKSYTFSFYEKLDEIIINIKTNNLVKNHNADKVKNNHYTWLIKRNDVKRVYFEFYPNKHVRRPIVTFLLIIIPILLLVGVIIYMTTKNKNINII